MGYASYQTHNREFHSRHRSTVMNNLDLPAGATCCTNFFLGFSGNFLMGSLYGSAFWKKSFDGTHDFVLEEVLDPANRKVAADAFINLYVVWLRGNNWIRTIPRFWVTAKTRTSGWHITVRVEYAGVFPGWTDGALGWSLFWATSFLFPSLRRTRLIAFLTRPGNFQLP